MSTDPDFKETILVIDDDRAVLNTVSLVLGRAGYRVVTADSGQSGFAILERNAHSNDGDILFSLIIIDWKMPGWDGLKVLSEIQTRAYKDVPVILMSGAVTREQLLNTAAKLATSVLLKPLDKETLLAKVGEIIGSGNQ